MVANIIFILHQILIPLPSFYCRKLIALTKCSKANTTVLFKLNVI